MGTADQLIAWARTQLGVTEDPPGSNKVRYWADIGMPTLNGSPWCAAFYLAGLTATDTRPVTRSVWVPAIVLDYKHARRLFAPADAEPGDQCLFHIGKGHTGVLESVDLTARTVTCIEGNTVATAGGGSQDNGGGVFRRTREWSLVMGCGRPDFAHNPGPVVPAQENPMMLIDAKGADDNGRDSHWEVLTPTGDIRNWNAARPLKSLGELVPTHPPIVAAALDPSGDGVVLFADDAHQDERGHWVRSTYKILAT